MSARFAFSSRLAVVYDEKCDVGAEIDEGTKKGASKYMCRHKQIEGGSGMKQGLTAIVGRETRNSFVDKTPTWIK